MNQLRMIDLPWRDDGYSMGPDIFWCYEEDTLLGSHVLYTCLVQHILFNSRFFFSKNQRELFEIFKINLWSVLYVTDIFLLLDGVPIETQKIKFPDTRS
jgi:hypothetical protein